MQTSRVVSLIVNFKGILGLRFLGVEFVPQTGYLCRAVKVDMQLSFFFILEERQLKQPVAVRLYEIDEASNKKTKKRGSKVGGFSYLFFLMVFSIKHVDTMYHLKMHTHKLSLKTFVIYVTHTH